MTITVGSRRLIVQVLVDQGRPATDQQPMSPGRADAEIARRTLRQTLQAERAQWESAAMLRGIGWPR